MCYLDSVKKMFEKDLFAMGIGIRIQEAKKDYAVCSLAIGEQHMNASGKVQGGVSYTLGDLCFAVAANSCGYITVTLDSTITHIRPAKGTILYAKAQVTTRTRHICSCKVAIYDDLGTDVAVMQLTGYITETPNGLSPEEEDA